MDRQREREGEGEREGERIRPGVKQLGLRRRTLDRAPLIVLGNPRIRGVLRPLPKRSYFCRVATPNIWPRVCAFWKFTIAVRCGFLCDLDLPIWHFASIRFAYRYLWRGKGVIFRYHEEFRFDLSRTFDEFWFGSGFGIVGSLNRRYCFLIGTLFKIYCRLVGCVEFGEGLAISIGFGW